LNQNESGLAGLEDSASWKQVSDSRYPVCWYRFTGDNQVEILALGARVVVPVDAVSLLPEPVARAVLSEMAERLARELNAEAKSIPAGEEP
jgi:hypothetical protein